MLCYRGPPDWAVEVLNDVVDAELGSGAFLPWTRRIVSILQGNEGTKAPKITA